jgi:hypothetical protein
MWLSILIDFCQEIPGYVSLKKMSPSCIFYVIVLNYSVADPRIVELGWLDEISSSSENFVKVR